MRLFQMKRMEQVQMMQGMAPQGGGPPPQGPPGPPPPMGGPPGLPPQVMPDAGLGGPPVPPTAPVGPAVPPGTPRPGAQSSENRLANMGLIPPAGG
jgi:hypothetical protein